MEPPDPAAALGSKHDRMANGAGGSSSGGGSSSSSSGAADTPAAGGGMGIEAPKWQEATNGDGASRPSKRRGLLAIVYSEFDNTLGPTIRFQAPDGFLSQELFDGISDYVITGRQLYGRVVAVATADYQVLGFPLAIENEKYARNTLLFNVSFVLPIHADTTPYEPILRKLALTLHAMEIESEFLFRPEKKAHLGAILGQILHDLTAHGECLLTLDEANLLSLKLTAVMREPPTVGDHEVPVFLRDPEVLKALDWDLALRQVIPHIDGVKYAKRIAMDAEMDVDCAKAALRTLVYYDFVALVDIFQFSNVYVTTAYFLEFCHNPGLQAACQRFVATDPSAPPAALPSIPDLLGLYGACQPGATLADVFLARRDKMESIDPRRFVTFGVVYGLLRRVHRHPILLRGAGGTGAGPPPTAAAITNALVQAGLLPPTAPAPSSGTQPPVIFPPSRSSSQSAKASTTGSTAPSQPLSQPQQQQQGADGGGDLALAVAAALQAQQQQQQQRQQQQPAPVSAQLVLQVQAMMDGTRTADELCVTFLRPYAELEALALMGAGEGAVVCVLYK